MCLSNNQLNDILEKAIDAVVKAGEIVNSFQNKTLNIQEKEGFSKNKAAQVVTDADFKSQDIILKELQNITTKYDLGLLTEELQDDKSRFIKDYFWSIDPLDGTLPFVENTDGCCISIALVNRIGNGIIGVIYNPKTKNLYYNKVDQGIFKNHKTLKVASNNKTLTLVFDRSFLKTQHYNDVIQYLIQKGYPSPKIISYGGAAMNAIWVLESNSNAAYFKFPKVNLGGGSLWDYAATASIFNTAGLPPITCFDKSIPLNQKNPFLNEHGVIYSNSKLLQQDILDYFKNVNNHIK